MAKSGAQSLYAFSFGSCAAWLASKSARAVVRRSRRSAANARRLLAFVIFHSPSDHDVAAIGMEGRADIEGGLLAGEQQGRGCNLLHPALAADHQLGLLLRRPFRRQFHI